MATPATNPYELLGELAESGSASEHVCAHDTHEHQPRDVRRLHKRVSDQETEDGEHRPPEQGTGQRQGTGVGRKKKRKGKKKKAAAEEDAELDRLVHDIENAKARGRFLGEGDRPTFGGQVSNPAADAAAAQPSGASSSDAKDSIFALSLKSLKGDEEVGPSLLLSGCDGFGNLS